MSALISPSCDFSPAEVSLRPVLMMVCAIIVHLVALAESSDLHFSLFPELCCALIMGCGFYLVIRGGWARLAGVSGLIIWAVIPEFVDYVRPAPRPRLYYIDIFRNYGSLGCWAKLWTSALMVLIGLGGNWSTGAKMFFKPLAGLIPALGLLLSGAVAIFVGGNFAIDLVGRLWAFSLAFIPAAMLAKAFDETGGLEILLSIGARFWCALIFMGLALFFASSSAISFGSPYHFEWIEHPVFVFPFMAGIFLLMCGLKGGFHVGLLGLIFLCFDPFLPFHYLPLNPGLLAARLPRFYIFLLLLAIVPLFTCLLIRSARVKEAAPSEGVGLSASVWESLAVLAGFLGAWAITIHLGVTGYNLDMGCVILACALGWALVFQNSRVKEAALTGGGGLILSALAALGALAGLQGAWAIAGRFWVTGYNRDMGYIVLAFGLVWAVVFAAAAVLGLWKKAPASLHKTCLALFLMAAIIAALGVAMTVYD